MSISIVIGPCIGQCTPYFHDLAHLFSDHVTCSSWARGKKGCLGRMGTGRSGAAGRGESDGRDGLDLGQRAAVGISTPIPSRASPRAKPHRNSKIPVSPPNLQSPGHRNSEPAGAIPVSGQSCFILTKLSSTSHCWAESPVRRMAHNPKAPSTKGTSKRIR